MINLMDLKKQNEIIRDKYLKEVEKILTTSQFILGDNVKEFERRIAEYHGVKYAVGVGNGTDALVISLKACGVNRGDEVIVPGMSFFATSEAVVNIGAIPVFVDVSLKDYTILTQELERKITSKTKCIIPVHLYGHPADMVSINKIAKKYDLKVIEDSCQAIGAQIGEKKVSSFGDAACISFFPTKNLGGVGDGGVILTNNEDIYNYCKALRVHGSGSYGLSVYKKLNDKNPILGEYEKYKSSKYNNSIIGFNSRLDELQAAALLIKLDYLDEWNNQRQLNARYYNENINNALLIKPAVIDNCKHVFYTYILRTEYRDEFIDYMKNNGVGTGIYFPIPLHKQLAHNDIFVENLNNSEILSAQNVAIPIYPELSQDELDFIVRLINKFEVKL